MLMCNEPMTIDLGQEHGEPCGRGHRLAVRHPGKLIEAGHDHCIVIDHDCPPLLKLRVVPFEFYQRTRMLAAALSEHGYRYLPVPHHRPKGSDLVL
jgi:hypothetical protein